MAKLPILNMAVKEIYFALTKVVNENILRNSPCVRLICNSNQTRKLALLAGVPPKRAVVVPVGIDSHLFAPALAGVERTTKAEQGTPLILTVAGVIPHKGQLDMIEAIKIIVGELKDALYINIGAIRDVAYYSQVLSRMKELGLENRCCFLGHIPHSDMLRLYHACDVYVQPSHQDGFNMSALQALSCGKQVVVTQAGAMPEYVQQIGAGRVVAPGLPEQLANAVIDLANKGAAMDPQKQHMKVAAIYDWTVIAKETLRIYQADTATAAQ
jgi:glycosyltransferase involved in cell wall biosynthesis